MYTVIVMFFLVSLATIAILSELNSSLVLIGVMFAISLVSGPGSSAISLFNAALSSQLLASLGLSVNISQLLASTHLLW